MCENEKILVSHMIAKKTGVFSRLKSGAQRQGEFDPHCYQ